MGLRHIAGRCGLPPFLRTRLAAIAVAVGNWSWQFVHRPWLTRTLQWTSATVAVSAASLAAAEPGCTSGGSGPQTPCPPGETCEVRLTLLHTADIHSRIFPYDFQILQIDSELGLGTLDEVKNIGGVARLSYVLNRERARADRSTSAGCSRDESHRLGCDRIARDHSGTQSEVGVGDARDSYSESPTQIRLQVHAKILGAEILGEASADTHHPGTVFMRPQHDLVDPLYIFDSC